MNRKLMNRKLTSENGNVLFLILIAVALFAALSYAVTSSSRSGSGSTERERGQLSAAAASQYGVSIRQAVTRMILSGVGMEDLEFNAPSNLGSCTDPSVCVFHPQGGGALYQQSPGDVMANGQPGNYIINMSAGVTNVGTTNVTGSNDLILFLPGVALSACNSVNESNDIPNSSSPPVMYYGLSGHGINENMDNTYSTPNYAYFELGTIWETPELDGRSEGCFYDNDTGLYVYYQVIAER